MCRWVAYAGPEIYVEDLIDHLHYPHREGTTDSLLSYGNADADEFSLKIHTSPLQHGDEISASFKN